MKTQSLLFRIPVVMLSLMLMIAYVYTQAGGIWPMWREPEAEVKPLAGPEAELRAATRARQIAAEKLQQAQQTEKNSPGSVPQGEIETLEDVVQWLDGKVAGLRKPSVPTTTVKPAMLPGSKSAIMVPPNSEPTLTIILPSDSEISPTPSTKPELMLGPKSAPVFLPEEPTPNPPVQQRATKKAPNAPARATGAPTKGTPTTDKKGPPAKPTRLLPGSKSMMVIDAEQFQDLPKVRPVPPTANSAPIQQPQVLKKGERR